MGETERGGETPNLYEAGMEAALAGEPCPTEPPQFIQGWQHGNAKRRIQAGEALGFVSHGTRCDACGDQNWGYRLGCRCNTSLQQQTVQWGALVDDGLAAGECAKFMTLDEIRASGKPLIEWYSGKEIPVATGSSQSGQGG